MPNTMMTFISSTFFKKDFIPSLHIYNSIACKRLQEESAYFRKLKKYSNNEAFSIYIWISALVNSLKKSVIIIVDLFKSVFIVTAY